MKARWLFLVAVLLTINPATADWWQATTAYEEKNYVTAKRLFNALIPLGNEDAAFNLAAMNFNGEGVNPNKIMALAYFMLAEELGRQDAVDLQALLLSQLDAEQIADAKRQHEQLRLDVKIWPKDRYDSIAHTDAPTAIKRPLPKYPKDVANTLGYVLVRILISEDGSVQAADVVDTYPKNTFERNTLRAVKRWQYEPSDKKHVKIVHMNFTVPNHLLSREVEKQIKQNLLWEGALMGSPNHQYLLGSILNLNHIHSGVHLIVQEKQPAPAELNLDSFKHNDGVRARIDGFVGTALVRVAPDGRILEQVKANFAPQSEVTDLVGLTLSGDIQTEQYFLSKLPGIARKAVDVRPAVAVPRELSANYWWDQAAKNGNHEAQRTIAAYDRRWESYLLEQQDPVVMAWTGTKMILEGEREKGMALLDAAIAKKYEPAAELKKHLM